MDFLKLAQDRYSCKKYNPDKKVSQDVLDKILRAGQLAPTAKNSQPQHIYVMQSEDALQTVDSLTPCRYGAPLVLAVTYDQHQEFTYPGDKYTSGIEDASIVATHMMLAAAAEGVDSCWLNFFDPDKAAEAMKLPENEKVVLLLDIGYAADGVRPTPMHEKTKSIEELVTYC
ncbi:nitroreductase family protein [Selenomonas sp. AE3005]|uniref:nitroreductase family protein n=1 Tax=Selenomonas sp. AE3005 TaxID=1485543 RepID=UPI0025F23014|nr:nitroreductase family protein [Selenomonas sp. AE3005]